MLLGTDSFWEGVDIPGEALEILGIIRLPFAVPSEPLVAAHMEELEKQGKNPFFTLFRTRSHSQISPGFWPPDTQ